MVDAMNVLIPDGLGNVMTMARETNMAVHTKPDRRGSSSEIRVIVLNDFLYV